MDKYITVSELAKELEFTSQTIRNWIRLGIIKAHRINPKGKFLISREDVDEYLRKCEE